MHHARVEELKDVRWDDVSCVARIAGAQSLRRAAKEAALTPSTLLRQVQRLEGRLGTQIFERRSGGVVPTEAGRVILRIAEEMEERFLRLREVARLDGERQGRVRLAAPEFLVSLWLGARVNEFVAGHEAVALSLDHLGRSVDEACDEGDLVIAFSKPQNPELVATRLGTLHLFPFAAPDLLQRSGLPDGLRRGQVVPTVRPSEAALSDDGLAAALRRLGAEPREALVTGSTLSLVEAMERGLGLGELPSFIAATGGRLAAVELGHSRAVPLWLCHRQQIRRVERVAATIQWLRGAFDGRRHPWFRPEPLHPAEIAAHAHEAAGERFMPRWAVEQLARRRGASPPPRAPRALSAAPRRDTAGLNPSGV